MENERELFWVPDFVLKMVVLNPTLMKLSALGNPF